MARERTRHRENAAGARCRRAAHVVEMGNLSTLIAWLVRDDRLRILVDIAQAATDTATAPSFVDRAGSIATLTYALLELTATILTDDTTWAPPPPAHPNPPLNVPAPSPHPETAREQKYDTRPSNVRASPTSAGSTPRTKCVCGI